MFAAIYQQLGLAWELLALQCKHWDGFRKTRSRQLSCPICGKVKGAGDQWLLLPAKGPKAIGRTLFPTSTRTFASKKEAAVDDDDIRFHGARLTVQVHNAYKSKMFREGNDINIAADRIVRLREGEVECWLDTHLLHVRWKPRDGRRRRLPYGAVVSELRKDELKKFPVILEYDDEYRLLGVNVFIPARGRKRR